MMHFYLYTLATALLNANQIGFNGPTSQKNVLLNVLNAVYFWAGVIAVGMIIYGGFIYTISNGDPAKIKKAKDALLYSVVGLVVVLVAFTITNFVIKGVNGA